MFKPYKVINETDEFVVYEYRTICLWVLYLILAVLTTGILLSLDDLSAAAGVAMVVYFFLVSLKYRQLGRLTREAALDGEVRITGSKWSFSKPLTVTLPK